VTGADDQDGRRAHDDRLPWGHSDARLVRDTSARTLSKKPDERVAASP